MSRTDKDRKYSEKPNTEPDRFHSEEYHYGCPLDPSGRKRTRYVTVSIEHPTEWVRVVKPCQKCVDGYNCGSHTTQYEWVLKPWVEEVTEVEQYIAVCDIEEPSKGTRGRKCTHSIHPVEGWNMYITPPKSWTRDFYYSPERRYVRDCLHDLAKDFNSHSSYEDLDDSKMQSTANPSGLWGGGYID